MADDTSVLTVCTPEHVVRDLSVTDFPGEPQPPCARIGA